MQFGRYYEEFEVGAIYKHWPGKTVTEYDDHLFCLLTMNHHPLHLDANYAEKTTDFGKNVVVGNYIYSLLLGMSVPDVSGKAIANLEVESLRHVAPTFHGDTIYGETTVLDKTPSKSKSDRGVVYVETIGYNQDGTVVCIFRRKVMVPTKEYIDARGGEQPGRPTPTLPTGSLARAAGSPTTARIASRSGDERQRGELGPRHPAQLRRRRRRRRSVPPTTSQTKSSITYLPTAHRPGRPRTTRTSSPVSSRVSRTHASRGGLARLAPSARLAPRARATARCRAGRAAAARTRRTRSRPRSARLAADLRPRHNTRHASARRPDCARLGAV